MLDSLKLCPCCIKLSQHWLLQTTHPCWRDLVLAGAAQPRLDVQQLLLKVLHTGLHLTQFIGSTFQTQRLIHLLQHLHQLTIAHLIQLSQIGVDLWAPIWQIHLHLGCRHISNATLLDGSNLLIDLTQRRIICTVSDQLATLHLQLPDLKLGLWVNNTRHRQFHLAISAALHQAHPLQSLTLAADLPDLQLFTQAAADR